MKGVMQNRDYNIQTLDQSKITIAPYSIYDAMFV